MKQKTFFLASLILIYLLSQLGYISFFSEERIIFSDTAFQLYKLINEGYPAVMTDRWPLVSQRVLPYLLLLFKAPLSSMVYGYSINIFLLEAAILMLLWVKRSYAYCLIWLLILLIARVETIFWCPSDLLIGLGLSLILFSVADHKKAKLWEMALWGISLLFCHPLVIFSVLFKGIYDFFIAKNLSQKTLVFYAILVVFWIIRNVFVSHWYVSAKRASLLAYVQQYSYKFWEIESNGQFMGECLTQYWPAVILTALIILYQFYSKRYLSIAFSLVFCLLYIQLVNYSNAVSAPSFYREASYIPVLFFILYPVKEELMILPKLKKWRWLMLLLAVMNIGNVIYHSSYFTHHIATLKTKIASQQCDKVLIGTTDEGPMQWGLPVETLLLSSMQGKSKTRKRSSSNAMIAIDQFLEPFGQIPISKLNQDYFDLEDTISYCNE